MHWDFALILLVAVRLLGRRRVAHLLTLLHTTKLDRLSPYVSPIAGQWFITAMIVWRCVVPRTCTSYIVSRIGANVFIYSTSVALVILVFFPQLACLRGMTSHPTELYRSPLQIAFKIFPDNVTELLVVVALVLTVAVCEELIYSGFAQAVFHWSNSILSIVESSVLFSAAHLYEGTRGLASTFVIGLLFAASVRAWTGSLGPSIGAHSVADLTVGLLAPTLIRAALTNKAASSASGAHHQRVIPPSQANV